MIKFLSYEVESLVGLEDGLRLFVLESSPQVSGTTIENTSATTSPPVNYEICDYSGFRAKRGTLVKTWDNRYVLPEFWEPRHDQDFVRSRPEQLNRGAIRPDDTGREIFITTTITADDL